jgi:hypothetical protein
MMVFAEIKHHETDLLAERSYRPDCWALSTELSGGITQAQQTVYRAAMDIRERILIQTNMVLRPDVLPFLFVHGLSHCGALAHAQRRSWWLAHGKIEFI